MPTTKADSPSPIIPYPRFHTQNLPGSISHLVPMNPGTQAQLNPDWPESHVPPFKQGFGSQKSPKMG